MQNSLERMQSRSFRWHNCRFSKRYYRVFYWIYLDYTLNTPFEFAFLCVAPPHRSSGERHVGISPPPPGAKTEYHRIRVSESNQKYVRRSQLCELLVERSRTMEEKTIAVTEKRIGDTIYIVESAVSSAAKESVYDKVRKLILNDSNSMNKRAS